MGWDDVGYSCTIEGRMDADLYVAIPKEKLQEILGYWGKTCDEVVSEQDNDPKNTSKGTKTWFDDHGFNHDVASPVPRPQPKQKSVVPPEEKASRPWGGT